MNILVNGEVKDIPEGITVGQLVDHLSLPPRRMAIELNKRVIRRLDWESTRLNERDAIEIVHFVGGG